jgi:hypothetical protein
MNSVATMIDALDNKQAIYQAKLLVQAASDATPAFATMSDEEIAAALAAALTAAGGNGSSDVTAMLASPEPLSAEDAGEAARRFLHVFAEAPGGGEVLGTSLAMSDTSADFGLITGPVLCAFAWLAISGDVDISIGGVHFRKEGLTGKQQVDLLKSILPGLIKQFAKADAN